MGNRHSHSTVIATFVLIVLSLVSAYSLVPVKADNNIDSSGVVILSPKSAVYHNSTIDLNVVVYKPTDQKYPLITTIIYSLNNSGLSASYSHANFAYNGITNIANRTVHQYTGNATLEGLKEGNYTLHVMYGNGNITFGSFSGSSVNFRVKYGNYEPATLLSPTNQTYHSSNVPLSISINEDYVYAYYCLNGGKPVFINKTSSTLSGLPLGSNNLLVFVKFRDIYSDFRINFTVDSTKIDNTQTTRYEWIALGLIGIVIVLVITVFFIKKKKANSKDILVKYSNSEQ
jgi:hypothetical protein